jgi:hypothetical protein
MLHLGRQPHIGRFTPDRAETASRWHRQSLSNIFRRRCHTNLNWRREVRKSQLGSCSRRSSSCLERLVAEDAEAAASGEMALDVENVLDSGVNRQKALG